MFERKWLLALIYLSLALGIHNRQTFVTRNTILTEKFIVKLQGKSFDDFIIEGREDKGDFYTKLKKNGCDERGYFILFPLVTTVADKLISKEFPNNFWNSWYVYDHVVYDDINKINRARYYILAKLSNLIFPQIRTIENFYVVAFHIPKKCHLNSDEAKIAEALYALMKSQKEN